MIYPLNSDSKPPIKEVTTYQQIVDGDAGIYYLIQDDGTHLLGEYIKLQDGTIHKVKGKFVDGLNANQAVYAPSNGSALGKVGINTNNPTRNLDVTGEIGIKSEDSSGAYIFIELNEPLIFINTFANKQLLALYKNGQLHAKNTNIGIINNNSKNLTTKEYVDAKYLIINQNTTYNYNLHNRRTLIIQNDVTLTMPQAMQDGFECTVLVDGNFTVTNAVEAGLTMSPLPASTLGENKMQYVVKVANRILIYGENE